MAAVAGVTPAAMKTTALVLNILTAVAVKFHRAGRSGVTLEKCLRCGGSGWERVLGTRASAT